MSASAADQLAYVYLPADAAFPMPCVVLSRDGERVQVAVGRTNRERLDIWRDNTHWVDASQVTTEPPQPGLFDEAGA